MKGEENILPFGIGDNSFQEAGGEPGIAQLVNDFYDHMGSDPRFASIYAMHPADKFISRDKLARFLCGWLGGPRRYQEKYGSISIPHVHQHLDITESEHDQWLLCMQETISRQDYSEGFKKYLYEQLCIPANVILARCQHNHN